MSLVVAVKDGDKVYMGADTQTTFGGNIIRRQKLKEGCLKITKMPNSVLLGHVGKLNCAQRLCTQADWFENLPEEGLTKKFLVQEIVPKFEKNIKAVNGLDKNGGAGCTYIVVWKDRIFLIEKDFSVLEIADCVAIGTPDYAYYSLLRPECSARERLLLALEVASTFSTNVSAPYVLTDSENLTFEFVEG